MARAERQVPVVYFGRPGSLLALPWPRSDLDKPYDRLTYDFVTGAGQHQVSSLLGGSRSFAVNWTALHLDTFNLLSQFWTGSMGAGPWSFIDPSAPNLLLPNQSGTTQQYNDARHWLTFNGTLSSNADPVYVHRFGARRSLRWLWDVAAVTNPILEVTPPYRNWFGTPVVPGLSYAFSAWVRPDNIVDSSITFALRIRWVDAAGAFISEIDGGSTAVTTWTRKSAIGVAPVGAVYAQPIVFVTGSTVTTGASLYFDEALFEQDTVVNDWAPGTGVRPVEILSLGESAPFSSRFRTKTTMVLRELAS